MKMPVVAIWSLAQLKRNKKTPKSRELKVGRDKSIIRHSLRHNF
jgi:hypothetical protein